MVDEKLEDEVWVTVVATGYGDAARAARARSARAALRASRAGEPRVTPHARARARRSRAIDVDVPEFIPRF